MRWRPSALAMLAEHAVTDPTLLPRIMGGYTPEYLNGSEVALMRSDFGYAIATGNSARQGGEGPSVGKPVCVGTLPCGATDCVSSVGPCGGTITPCGPTKGCASTAGWGETLPCALTVPCLSTLNCGGTVCNDTSCAATHNPPCGDTIRIPCAATCAGGTLPCGVTLPCGATECDSTQSCGSSVHTNPPCGSTAGCGSTLPCGGTECGDTNKCGATIPKPPCDYTSPCAGTIGCLNTMSIPDPHAHATCNGTINCAPTCSGTSGPPCGQTDYTGIYHRPGEVPTGCGDTCGQSCFQTCLDTCARTCSASCYKTCSDTCAQTCAAFTVGRNVTDMTRYERAQVADLSAERETGRTVLQPRATQFRKFRR